MLVFCLFIPFPHGYTVSRGVPVRLLRMTQKTFPIKRREFVKIYTRRIRKFDEFLGFLTGSENPSVRVANLTFDQTNSFHSFVCLLLVCSFSPKVQKYLLGSPFSRFFGFRQNAEKSLIFGFFHGVDGERTF